MSIDPIIPKQKVVSKGESRKVLVTGATGFLGKRLVELLIQKGYDVRALARKASNIENLRKLNVEIFFGDVADIASLRPAFEGINYVVHAAADTSDNEEAGRASTIQGTKNIINLCEEFKIKKLVYISSCSVYGVADYQTGQTVTEESSLERFPVQRGAYSYSKLEAEGIVRQAIADNRFPIVCLRPGTIWGPGGEVFTPMMGFSLGRKLFAIIGPENFVLPFVYIDNLVDAIIASMESTESNGKVFNVVDMERLTKKDYTDLLLRKLYPKARYIYIPYSILYLIVFLQEVLLELLKRKPFLTRYRLNSSQKRITYDASKIRSELHWNASVPTQDAVRKVVEHEQSGKQRTY